MGRQYSKRRYRRKRRAPSKITYGQMVNKVYRDVAPAVRFFKSVLNVEKMSYDENVGSQLSVANNVGDTGEFVCITNMASGDTETGRTGMSLLAKSIQLIGDLHIDASATSSTVRMIMFVDRSHHGITPTSAELLESDSTLSFKNNRTRTRFQILLDKRYHLDDAHPQIDIKEFVKLNFHMKYDGTTVQDTYHNPVYIYLISDEGTNKPELALLSRFRYYDN